MPLLLPADMPLVENPEVVIDGRADEAAWAEATEIEGFVVYRPQPGATPSGQTRVKVMASEEALYVHFEADTPEPEALRSGYGRRDSRRNDDFVGVLLDTQGGRERGALFLVNPLGVQTDGILVRGGDSELVPWRGGWSSWDTRWFSAGHRTEDGYTVEIKIPWSSVRHPEVIDEARVLFVRRSATSSEMSSWPVLDPSVQGVLTQTDPIGGPGKVKKSSPWQFRPEITATRSDQGIPEDRLGVRGIAPGMTMQYAPGAGLQLLATVNPDFSQVESDQAKIDVNQRYSVQYEEKRPFFLEGQEWFRHPMDDLIYTRTMVTPLYGARATSESGDLTMSALHVWDRQPSSSVSEGGGWSSDELSGREALATVARARLALGADSMVGAIVSDRNIIGTQKRHHLFGLDGRVALSEAFNLEGAILASSTKGDTQDGEVAPAAVLRKRWNGGRVESFVEAQYISKKFRSENGFQPLADWMSVRNETEFFIFPEWRPVPRIFIMPASAEGAWTTEGKPRLYSYEPGFGFWTSGGALFWFEAELEGESYAGEWLDTVSGNMMAGGSWTRWLRTWIRASAGEGVLYDESNPSIGQKTKANLDINLQPIERLFLGPQIGIERFTQQGTEVYSGHVFRFKVEAYATNSLWSRIIYDRSSFDDSQAYEALFAWEHSPGSAIYLGGSTRLIKGTADQPSPTDGEREWTMFTKASWVFDG